MVFEVWDLVSGNRLGEFNNQGDALEAIEDILIEHGTSYVKGLALAAEDSHGWSGIIAKGDALVEYLNSADLGR